MTPAKIAVAMFLLALAPVLSCSKPADPGTTFMVRGEVVSKPFEGQALRIRHEKIPGVMDAMTMDFKLKDPAAGKKIQNGDKIRFRYVMNGVDSYIDQIEVLNPDTSLDLAGDDEMHMHKAAEDGGAK